MRYPLLRIGALRVALDIVRSQPRTAASSAEIPYCVLACLFLCVWLLCSGVAIFYVPA